MRSISFSLTEQQLLDGSKDVTRRLGWITLDAGTELKAVRKAMGLKKGEKQYVLGMVTVRSVRRERLEALTLFPDYGREEARREGFAELGGPGFVAMFCREMRVKPDQLVTRIQFTFTPEVLR